MLIYSYFNNFVGKNFSCWVWVNEGKELLWLLTFLLIFHPHSKFICKKKSNHHIENTHYGKPLNNKWRLLCTLCCDVTQARSCICEFTGKEITQPKTPLYWTQSSFTPIFQGGSQVYIFTLLITMSCICGYL